MVNYERYNQIEMYLYISLVSIDSLFISAILILLRVQRLYSCILSFAQIVVLHLPVMYILIIFSPYDQDLHSHHNSFNTQFHQTALRVLNNFLKWVEHNAAHEEYHRNELDEYFALGWVYGVVNNHIHEQDNSIGNEVGNVNNNVDG